MTLPQSEYIFIELAVDYPTAKDRTYTYRAPAQTAEKARLGSAFLVEFNKRPAVGYLTGFTSEPPDIKISNVTQIIESFSIPEELVGIAKKISSRYGSSIAQIIRLCSPPGEGKKIKKTIEIIGELNEVLTSNEIGLLQEMISSPKIDHNSAFLKNLRNKKLIRINNELVMQVPREKTTRAFKLGTAAGHKLTPRQKALVTKLQEKGQVSLRELKSDGFSADILNRLLKQRVIESIEVCLREAEPVNCKAPICSLTAEQEHAFGKIKASIGEGSENFYLWGITGSGKTEIYKRAALEALDKGLSSIILVPEIALTPQLEEQFRQYFGSNLAILHSRLPGSKRLSNWLMAYSGRAQVILGTRLAIFAPVQNLGLIVLDEEHENSYKQNNQPRYDARIVAAMRAEVSGATLIYGSATPSIENYHSFKNQTLNLLKLSNRINNLALPQVELIDMRSQETKGLFSGHLLKTIEQELDQDRKIMLFLNRRGFSRYLSCYDCSFIALCPNCSISLTYHNSENKLLCHYCNFQNRAMESCPKCGGHKIVFRGTGTQRIEQELAAHFPEAKIFRMDSDSTTRQGSHGRILSSFQNAQKAILLGTQMIAKGLHFPRVSVVGIINADTILNMPDFRAAERTFQLLVQMSGRCGRGDERGKVVVQTYNPDHYAIQCFAADKIDQFYEEELNIRKEALYPPYTKLVNIIFSSEAPLSAKEASERFRGELSAIGGITSILGPAPAPIHKLNKNFRWHILLKVPAGSVEELVNELHSLMLKLTSKSVKILIDVDPIWLL